MHLDENVAQEQTIFCVVSALLEQVRVHNTDIADSLFSLCVLAKMSDYKKKVSSFDIMEDLSLFGGDFSSRVSGVTFTTRFNRL